MKVYMARMRLECSGCRKKGHTNDRCWEIYPDLAPEPIRSQILNKKAAKSIQSPIRQDHPPGIENPPSVEELERPKKEKAKKERVY